MAIGARDYIDQLLVKKYAQEKVDNHENREDDVSDEWLRRNESKHVCSK